MFQPTAVLYPGKNQFGIFSGAISGRNFYLVLEIAQGATHEEGQKALLYFEQTISESNIIQLADFEMLCADAVKAVNLSFDISFACVFVNNNVLYAKTMGGGEIYIQRKGGFAKIIHGNKSASGYIHNRDTYILTTKDFIRAAGGEESIKRMAQNKNFQEAVDQTNINSPAIFLRAEKGEEEEQRDIIFNKTFSLKKEFIVKILVFIIFFILVWSVLLGYQRRIESKNQKKIQVAKELVSQKLQESADIVFLNSERALILLSESKDVLQKLEKEIGKKYEKQIKELVLQIEKQESGILKKENKNFEEFFDLSVENKDAHGDFISLSGSNLSILDKKGNLYVVSLQRKSLSKREIADLRQTSLFSSFENKFAIYAEGDGIYTIDKNNALIKTIEKDGEWEMVKGLQFYGGNIYVFDTGKSEIYKYVEGETGFSEKTPYFKQTESVNISEAGSFAIDGSIYIAFDSAIIKYTSGVRDAFQNSFPDKDIAIEKIYTNKELERVYIWDKQKGTIYILEKKGVYERQIVSDILKKAVDFVVYEDNIYILLGPKIFRISIL